jgi:hypothetical protein
MCVLPTPSGRSVYFYETTRCHIQEACYLPRSSFGLSRCIVLSTALCQRLSVTLTLCACCRCSSHVGSWVWRSKVQTCTSSQLLTVLILTREDPGYYVKRIRGWTAKDVPSLRPWSTLKRRPLSWWLRPLLPQHPVTTPAAIRIRAPPGR